MAAVERAQGAHRRRRRVPDRPLPARPPPDRRPRRSRSTARCAPSTRRRTCSCSTSASFQLVGSSPETHVRLDTGRHLRAAADRGHAAARRRPRRRTTPWPTSCWPSEKERAEHVMLVDLARNDLGRVCVPGSRRGCERSMDVERYSHVMHIVSQRRSGSSRAGRDAVALLRATFPAGHGVRRAQGAGDADHLRARGPPPRRLRRRRRLPRLRRRHGHLHRAPHDRACATASPTCRRARGSWPTPTRRRSTRSA